MRLVAARLARLLADPARASAVGAAGWAGMLSAARAERLLGTLAARLVDVPVPPAAAAILADARAATLAEQRTALWEVEMARRALAPLALPIVLLKGSAYAAAGLTAADGRAIGDLDILVPRAQLDRVEAALLGAGWEWAKPDAYDDGYYRRWMHELPPMIHATRDRMIDVHHTILPLTARPRPDAAALIADQTAIGGGLAILSPVDLICHAAAHLFADGDMAGGLRNLWDIRCLIGQFGDAGLTDRAQHHGLAGPVARALRLVGGVFDGAPLSPVDRLFARRMLARDDWGRSTRPVARFGFYVRSHWLRMPPPLLARHLWIKWRRQRARSVSSVAASAS